MDALLERGSVYVHLDPRRPGVRVPEQFEADPQLVLQIGYDFPNPIPDLEIDDDGISCTLSFSRSPFHCVVPWSAVYALIDCNKSITAWPVLAPPELGGTSGPAVRREPKERGARKPAPSAGRTLPRDRAAPSDRTGKPVQPPRPAGDRSHLRVVK